MTNKMVYANKLTRKQAICLQLYRQGLTQEQIANKVGDYQGNISRIMKRIKDQKIKAEVQSIINKNLNDRDEKMSKALSDKWLKAEKELGY